jgi:hypothetical protein
VTKVARMTVGEALIANGYIDQATLDSALERQRQSGRRLQDELIAMGAVAERDIREVTASRMNIPFVELRKYILDPEVVGLVPPELVRRHRIVPLHRVGNKLTLATENPLDVLVLDDIQLLTGLQVRAVESSPGDIDHALEEIGASVTHASMKDPEPGAAKPGLLDALLARGLIDGEKLEKVRGRQAATGEKLGEALIASGVLTEGQLREVTSCRIPVPFLRERELLMKLGKRSQLPLDLIRRHRAIPVESTAGRLTVAMTSPLDVLALDELRAVTKLEVRAVIAEPGDIAQALAAIEAEERVSDPGDS